MAAWQPPTPIDALFQQLKDGIYFAAAANEPLVDTDVAQMGYNIMVATGLFTEACCEWWLMEPDLQTFAAFQQAHFRKMENYRRVTSVTSATAGFQSGHPAAHFSSATSTTSSLSTNPSVLVAEIISLRAQLALAVVSPAPSTGRQRTPATRGYCWTHGSSGNVAHTSAFCSNPAEGH
jgi:hypothetical protein